jgi:dihydrofolate synthase/folylpolyglutamate synthase
LGNSIEEIASTKLRSIESKALIAKQPYQEVYNIAKDIAKDRNTILYLADKNIELHLDWSSYLIDNALVAIEALDILNIKYNIKDLENLELFGRFYKFRDNIILDVGHNVLASEAIVNSLDREIVLIYNSLDDKDYFRVLEILKPKIKRVEIIKISSQRATTINSIESALDKLKIPYSLFNGNIDKTDEYLVFGSFYVVEEFLFLFCQ